MPTTIKTEAARVALAHREFNQEDARIRQEFVARMKALRSDPRATDRAAFEKLCNADQELVRLTVELEVMKVWRDTNIADGCVATIEDDGEVRWTLPQYANQPRQ
jgi:hypothetical protein